MTLIAPNHIEPHTGRLLTQESAEDQGADSGKHLVSEGQIIYSKIRPALNKAAIAPSDCLCSADMYALSLKGKSDARYALYYMLSRPFYEFVSTFSSRVKMPKVNREEIGDAPWLVPPAYEQSAIADYLDRETAKIDTLIVEQQQLIDMLRERRKAVVRHALTTGETWTPSRIKHVAGVSLGKMLDGGRAVGKFDTVAPYVRAADILANGCVNFDGLNHMPFSPEEVQRLDLKKGDVLVIEGGSAGRPAYLDHDAPGIYFQKTVNRVRTGSGVNSRFIYWVLREMYDADYFSNYYGSVSFIHLTAEKLREIPIFLPPIEEQKNIASQLDRETTGIDTLIAESEKLIELSRERRSALITAAVTGQIDIPQEV